MGTWAWEQWGFDSGVGKEHWSPGRDGLFLPSVGTSSTSEMGTATCWVRKLPWRRKWQPTPVFLPGIPHGQRSLAGYSPWGCKESDVTKVTEDTHTHKRIVLQPLSWGVHSSWILVGCSLTLVVTCPMHSCAAGLCVCVLGLECTEESGWVGVSDPDLSATRHIPGGEGAENSGAMWAPPCGLDPVAPIWGPHWMQGVRRREKGWVPGCQDSGRGLRTHQEHWGSARGRTVCELRL